MKDAKGRRRKEAARYRPVLTRGECVECNHWGVLRDGVCSRCRGNAEPLAAVLTPAPRAPAWVREMAGERG